MSVCEVDVAEEVAAVEEEDVSLIAMAEALRIVGGTRVFTSHSVC